MQQRIRFPCTTMSMPSDFNPNASDERAKGISFTFKWKWARSLVPRCMLFVLPPEWRRCGCLILGVSFTMTHLVAPTFVLLFQLMNSNMPQPLTTKPLMLPCRNLWGSILSVLSNNPPQGGGLRLTSLPCNDHLYVCRENEQPHTIMGLLHADPNSYNK